MIGGEYKECLHHNRYSRVIHCFNQCAVGVKIFGLRARKLQWFLYRGYCYQGFIQIFFAGGGRNGCTTPSFTVIGSIFDIFKEKNRRISL